MEVLSKGFCAAALVQSLAPNEVEAWEQQWRQPTLQVVDIQRYPRVPTASCGPSRFYVAVSDAESVAWLVIPPRTALEDSVAAFEIEVGCCVTLLSHMLVTAANGLNVIVPLQARYSSSTRRLLGHPNVLEAVFPLSANSLLRRQDAEGRELRANTAAPQRPLHPIAIRDFTDAPQRALGNWCVTARVVWKGRVYPLNPHMRRFGGVSDTRCPSSTGSPRFVFRCLLADEHGDAIVAAFFGSETLGERVRLHGCYRLAEGTVKWGTGESGAPSELQFQERSIEEELTADVTRKMLPSHASALVGEVAQRLRNTVAVIETAQVGEYLSVVGTVMAVQGNTQVTTKRGRVWRSVVTLANSAGARGGSESLAEVTLWGEVAETAEPAVGERWVFHPCVVQVFQQRKTLSSVASTMAVRLAPHGVSEQGPPHATVPPGRKGEGESAVAGRKASSVGESEYASQAVRKDMQLVLDLQKASPTLPALARVQEAVPPFLKWVCSECSRTQQSETAAVETVERTSTTCAHCGAAQLGPMLHLRVWLSDGLCTALAVFHAGAAESLLEASTAEVAQHLERQSALAAGMFDRLAGLPVLVWLLPSCIADAFAAAQFTVTNCKRISYISGCHTLLSAIDVFAGSGKAAHRGTSAASPKPLTEADETT
ncbi:hypothetical protein LSCM1_02446 [Leishmania martiniquensis]|uniref:Uncharacterized protein n=1 Tax=Leishmania martiniquensis TaxID=1580590 RepID=A0A836G5L8_9TRYP|nr:hypothetical protein LSCM1_02446 [Leishmania martiniquensis]